MTTRILLAIMFAALTSGGMVGCNDKTASTKQETVQSTEGGTTTTTTEKEVKTTGENPPAAVR
ncbi:MAG: hypothetical protein KF847_07465 [Pirellulales bacterium]|nr:hypothetical protein [Pirellulales bacterium]